MWLRHARLNQTNDTHGTECTGAAPAVCVAVVASASANARTYPHLIDVGRSAVLELAERGPGGLHRQGPTSRSLLVDGDLGPRQRRQLGYKVVDLGGCLRVGVVR
jgi:hypothetical protein